MRSSSGVSGGGTCAPIAHDILTALFDMEKGKEFKPTYMTPAVGHFKGVVEVTNTLNAGGDANPSAATPAAAVPADTTTTGGAGDEPAVVPEDDTPSIMPKRKRF